MAVDCLLGSSKSLLVPWFVVVDVVIPVLGNSGIPDTGVLRLVSEADWDLARFVEAQGMEMIVLLGVVCNSEHHLHVV